MRKNQPHRKDARREGALSRGWTFAKRPEKDRQRLINEQIHNTQKNLFGG